MSRVSLIVAMDYARTIGVDGDMPWHLPADLKWFKRTTLGKPIIMGRKTHESIGRALPGRPNIVLTRNPEFSAEGCTVVGSLADALAATADADEAMIIGGATLYAAALPSADRLYLTVVHATFEGDTHFPPLDPTAWRVVEVEHREADDKNPYATSYYTLDRVAADGEVAAEGLPTVWRTRG